MHAKHTAPNTEHERGGEREREITQLTQKLKTVEFECVDTHNRRCYMKMDPHTPRPDSQPQAGVAAKGAATTTTQRALTNFLAMPLTMTIKTTSGAQAQVGSMTELGELQTAACITRTRPRGSPGLRLGSC